jgi:hypothetical protein
LQRIKIKTSFWVGSPAAHSPLRCP